MKVIHYKDKNPIATVQTVRDILSKLGLVVFEHWMQSVEGYYSVHLKIDGTSYFVNGKGATRELALASGYGELMERIQTLALFKFRFNFKKESLHHNGFVYDRNEKYLSLEDVFEDNQPYMDKFLFHKESIEERRALLSEWLTIEEHANEGKFLALPFTKVTDNTLHYIPARMIDVIYGTNGLCAGNSMKEALVEGLSELIERHVNKRILEEAIVLPTISQASLKKYPHILEMVNKLKSKGPFEIIFKDCSLGGIYPAVAMIFIDKVKNAYFVKFGTHPVIAIAMERCLTELLQGRDINNRSWLKPFSYKLHINERKNMDRIFINGDGFYPAHFFSDMPTYAYVDMHKEFEKNNDVMFDYLVDLITSRGYEIYVKDCSILGFNAYQIIIPNFGEIFDDSKAIRFYQKIDRISKVGKNLEKASEEDLKAILDFMDSENYTSEDGIATFLMLPLKKTFPWQEVKRDLLKTMIHYKLGNHDKAYMILDGFIRQNQANSNAESIGYYKAVRDFIGLMGDGKTLEQSRAFLSQFYNQQTVLEVVDSMKEKEEVFKYMSQLNCSSCDTCEHTSHCYYKNNEKVFFKVKEHSMLLTPIVF